MLKRYVSYMSFACAYSECSLAFTIIFFCRVIYIYINLFSFFFCDEILVARYNISYTHMMEDVFWVLGNFGRVYTQNKTGSVYFLYLLMTSFLKCDFDWK